MSQGPMLDALAIVSTCALLLLVALRAMRMDREEPWFPPVDPAAAVGGKPEPRRHPRRGRRPAGAPPARPAVRR